MFLFSYNFYLFSTTKGCRVWHFSLSNYLQNINRFISSAILFSQWIDWLIYRISHRFAQTWFGSRASAMKNQHSLVPDFDHRPDIFTVQSFRHFEVFSQHLNHARSRNLTDEMNSSSGQWHRIRQTLYRFLGQSAALHSSAGGARLSVRSTKVANIALDTTRGSSVVSFEHPWHSWNDCAKSSSDSTNDLRLQSPHCALLGTGEWK